MGIREEIAKVAYELYEKRGRTDGSHVDDWLEAEKIVMARRAGKKEVEVKRAEPAISKAAAKLPKEQKSKSAPQVSSKKKVAVRRSSAEKAL